MSEFQHLTDSDLYRRYYEHDQEEGRYYPLPADEPRWLWAAERIGPSDDVIDLGCHKGEMTGRIHLWTRGRVVGVDLAESALAMAREIHPGVEFIQADVASVPLPDASFDVAVLCEILEHVPDAEAVIREAERLVRPGGRIVVSSPIGAVEMGEREAEERSKCVGVRLNAHVREFDPAVELADRDEIETAEAGREPFRFYLGAYRRR